MRERQDHDARMSNRLNPGNESEPILARIDWPRVSRRARREQRSRERHTPTISVYRWWARRPHSVVGAILDAARAQFGRAPRLADPFSGGATVAIEGVRRGLATYAQDLNPWATTGLRLSVAPVEVAALEAASGRLADRIRPLVSELYGSVCAQHGAGAETLHALWVRVADCPDCGHEVRLYPYTLLTVASRRHGETHGYFGCPACGRVTRSRLKARTRRCACGRRLASPSRALVPERRVRCPGCRSGFHAFDAVKRWELALVQRRCQSDGRVDVHFDRPNVVDRAKAARRSARLPSALRARIGDGQETRILRRAGLRRWADLYVPRQLAVLLAAARGARELDAPRAIRDRLLLAICGAAEMAGRLSRWDRYHPKAFEAIANHRYAVVGVTCESNPFGSSGRGTVPRRLTSLARAARWMEKHPATAVMSRSTGGRGSLNFRRGLVVVRGSSERQRLPDRSIDLVLTDPPYFADVQYGELASIFVAWGHATGLISERIRVDLAHEAVPNQVRGTDASDYERLLSGIFRETRRVLRPTGVMVLTFHSTELRAWMVLARVLDGAGFAVRALAVVHSENERDHAKRDRLGFTKDLVLECVPRRRRGALLVVNVGRDAQARELLALGRVVAGAQAKTDDELSSAFLRALRRFDGSRVRTPSNSRQAAS